MIARITYSDSELGTVTATLGEDATWTADDPGMARSLNASIASEDRSPARGDWLVWHAEKMAKLLDAEIELETKNEPPGDVRY